MPPMIGHGPSRLPVAAVLTFWLGLAALAAPAGAQSTLIDGTCVVVTGDGLYMVANQVTIKVFPDTAFGGLVAPSVTWIDGTNEFIVTTRDDAVGGPGSIFRVTLTPAGTGTLADLTPSLPAGFESRFIDADYSPALDTLFLLQAQQGLIASWARPATDSLATMTFWGSVPVDDAHSIAVRGAKQPFGIAVALASGPVLRVDKQGTTEIYPSGSWNDIASNPVTGDLIVSKQSGDKIGQLAGGGGLIIDFNVSGFCGPLVPQPADVEWDPVAGRAVAISGADMVACAASLGATGTNHIVRLPLTASGGGASNQPVLLTPTGLSGITGKRADIALVRHYGAEVTYWGYPAPGEGTSDPTFGSAGALVPGASVQFKLSSAPPSAAALLVMGLHPAPFLFHGQTVVPAPQTLAPLATGASGAAQLTIKLPASAAPLVGFDVYTQWVVDDTTTAAAGDVVTSQLAVFTIGLP